MMTPIRSILIVCLFHALGPSAFMWQAQGPFLQPLSPAHAQSNVDLKKASVTVSTDKSVYLPGEVIRITFAVANTTTGVLSVLDPFDIGVSGGVDVWRLDSKAIPPEWRPTAPHPNYENRWRGVTPVIPLVRIPAGRKTELTLASYESLRGDPRPLVSPSGAPLFPGEATDVLSTRCLLRGSPEFTGPLDCDKSDRTVFGFLGVSVKAG